MTTVEKIIHLIEKSGQSDYEIARSVELDRNSISSWRAGRAKPSADALNKIATYFNVTTDYLLGRTDNPYPADAPPLHIPPDVADALVAFHRGIDNLTQDEIDDAAAFIRARRQMRKNKEYHK
jgi:transcriptional regulator with XRE-family HTH domain